MSKVTYIVAICLALAATTIQTQPARWSKKKAQDWYSHQGWLCGANFIPSTAVNQLEMWQADTFDPKTIDKELGYAEGIGMNCMRVFLHHAAWQGNPAGFKTRLNDYLAIADKHHIKTMFVFFDDCWNDTYYTGKQPAPKPGTHNSGWLQDPGKRIYDEPKLTDTLQNYVKDILATFKHDNRVLAWDLYNEPGNNGHAAESLNLLQLIFSWARQIDPDQPLTTGYWASDAQFTALNSFILANSDVITYHDYEDAQNHQQRLSMLKAYGRPLICTEYMARKRHSTFLSITPLLKAQRTGAMNWGLVSGKTNTKYAWDEPHPDGSEPALWFHDIFYPDGTPYDQRETDLIKSLTEK